MKDQRVDYDKDLLYKRIKKKDIKEPERATLEQINARFQTDEIDPTKKYMV